MSALSKQELAELDLAVAIADGAGTDLKKMKLGQPWATIDTVPNAIQPFPACLLGLKISPRGKHPLRSRWYYPSTVWNDGGSIIERERISLQWVPPTEPQLSEDDCGFWAATMPTVGDSLVTGFGPTPLIAAMRAFTVSKGAAK